MEAATILTRGAMQALTDAHGYERHFPSQCCTLLIALALGSHGPSFGDLGCLAAIVTWLEVCCAGLVYHRRNTICIVQAPVGK
jgi:hypothetical protein